MFVLGMAACILPLGSLARKEGRKAAFMVGTGAGVITGLTAALAVVVGSFLLFCIINCFGAMRIAAAGLIITACSVLAGLSGTDIIHYWLSLILLGLGWNFGFTGASAKIIEYHRPEEKTQVQSLNDFVVFRVMIVGSFSSGTLLSLYG